MSHVNFGLFLNTLVIQFSKWKNSLSHHDRHTPFSYQSDQVVSCLFQGDYLESTAVSHWHARSNLYMDSYKQTICPEFNNFDYANGKFLNLYQQLIFINHLITVADKCNKPILQYLCDTINQDYNNKRENDKIQRSLFDKLEDATLTYNRIVLNLCHFPKNNAHHTLINSICAQEEKLKADGHLFVLSSKKLFVPSQKSKIEALLKRFKVEGIFTIDELKGKGEIPGYIYIFSKNHYWIFKMNRRISLVQALGSRDSYKVLVNLKLLQTNC